LTAHDPEKHVLDPDRGWMPVFGKDHAQTMIRDHGIATARPLAKGASM
jgi:hypothetical protein